MTATVAAEGVPNSVRARPASGQKLAHLQALRCLAASLVVLSHSVVALTERHLIPDSYASFADSGYFGVVTFFVISGFIIYKTSRNAFGDSHNIAEFVVKRLIRVWPVYWIATALFVVLSPQRAQISASDVIFSLLLLPHTATAVGSTPVVGQGWTLQFEMMFYLIFAVSLLLSRRNGTMLIVTVLVALVAFGVLVVPPTGGPETIVQYYCRPIILLFAFGIGFSLLEERMAGRLAIPYPFLLMIALIAVWFLFCLTAPISSDSSPPLLSVVVIWVLGALSVFVSVFGRSKEGPFEHAAHAVGDASYSVYLFHTFILSALLRLHVQDVSPALFILAALVASNVFGLVMFSLVEKHILAALRGKLLSAVRR